MHLNSTDSGPRNEGEGGQQAVPVEPAPASTYARGLWIKIFLAAIVAATVYEAVKQIALPHVTLWRSHVITIIVFGVISTLAVYAALRARSGLVAQLRVLSAINRPIH